MGLMVKDLRPSAQPIAEELISRGFTMVDLVSIGILFLDGKDAVDISELVKEVNSNLDKKLTPKEIVAQAQARAIAHKRKWGQKPLKSG